MLSTESDMERYFKPRSQRHINATSLPKIVGHRWSSHDNRTQFEHRVTDVAPSCCRRTKKNVYGISLYLCRVAVVSTIDLQLSCDEYFCGY